MHGTLADCLSLNGPRKRGLRRLFPHAHHADSHSDELRCRADLLSSLVVSSEAAMALTPIALIPQVVLGGCMVPMTSKVWLPYVMAFIPARWSLEGVMGVERRSLEEAWKIKAWTPRLSGINQDLFNCALRGTQQFRARHGWPRLYDLHPTLIHRQHHARAHYSGTHGRRGAVTQASRFDLTPSQRPPRNAGFTCLGVSQCRAEAPSKKSHAPQKEYPKSKVPWTQTRDSAKGPDTIFSPWGSNHCTAVGSTRPPVESAKRDRSSALGSQRCVLTRIGVVHLPEALCHETTIVFVRRMERKLTVPILSGICS